MTGKEKREPQKAESEKRHGEHERQKGETPRELVKNVGCDILKSQHQRRPRTAGRGVLFDRRVRGADPDEAETRRGYHATDCGAWFPVS